MFVLRYNALQGPIFQFQAVDEVIPEIDSLFFVFFKYWVVCSKRYREYTSLEVEFISAELYQFLSDYSNRKKWEPDFVDFD